ncbi:hypothetical protein LINPERHAP1_LOCUS17520 [Linum perenne]
MPPRRAIWVGKRGDEARVSGQAVSIEKLNQGFFSKSTLETQRRTCMILGFTETSILGMYLGGSSTLWTCP